MALWWVMTEMQDFQSHMYYLYSPSLRWVWAI